MDLAILLGLLREELSLLNEAILTLEREQMTVPRRRGVRRRG